MTLIAAILVLQSTILFAGNETVSALESNAGNNFSIVSLAPVTPATATFEDFTTVTTFDLAPVMPVEATFEEMPAEAFTVQALAPLTPAEADFSDAVETPAADLAKLAPVAPAEADFE